MRAKGQRRLRFVRCGSILVQRGIGLRPGPPPPSLGVSSLDLGRRLADGPFFLWGALSFLWGLSSLGLFGCGAIGPQLLLRDGGEPLRQGREISGQAIEARRALKVALVHIERAVEFELDGM